MPIRSFDTHSPVIAPTAYIDPLAVVIGQVHLGDYVSLWPMVVVRGDINQITIGARSNIQEGSILHVTHKGRYAPNGYPLTIGEHVTVGHNVTLHACTIEHLCLIGIGAIVLDGAVLPPYTLLAAGSLVPPHKVLAGGYLWRGRPAAQVRALTEDEIAYFDYSTDYYVKLGQRHKEQNYACEKH